MTETKDTMASATYGSMAGEEDKDKADLMEFEQV